MRPSRQRVAWVTGLRVAAVCSAGDLGGVEGHRLCHRHTLRAIQGVRAFFLDTPAIAAGVGGADSVRHWLLNNRRAAVVDVAGCSGSQTLSQLVVAGYLLHSRVCPVDRDADRHQRRSPASPILAGVEAFAAQSVVRLHDQAVGCVYIGAGWPVATSSVPARPQGWTDLNYSAVAVEVRSKATACSAA